MFLCQGMEPPPFDSPTVSTKSTHAAKTEARGYYTHLSAIFSTSQMKFSGMCNQEVRERHADHGGCVVHEPGRGLSVKKCQPLILKQSPCTACLSREVPSKDQPSKRSQKEHTVNIVVVNIVVVDNICRPQGCFILSLQRKKDTNWPSRANWGRAGRRAGRACIET